MKWFKENYNLVISFVIGFGIAVIIMGAMWPKRIGELKDGGQVIAEYNGNKVTADMLFKELQVYDGGVTALLNLVDLDILKKLYTDENARDTYAQGQVDYYLEVYSNQGYTEEDAIREMNANSKTELLDYFKNQYYFQEYYKDYAKSQIKEKEIEKYYKNYVSNMKSVIVYSSASKADVDGVRDMLKNGKKRDDITKKYSGVAVNELSNLTFVELEAYSETFGKNVRNHSKGSYTKVFSDDSFGYVVIDVTKEGDKPTLEEAREDIITVLTDRMIKKDENMYNRSLVELREKYNLKINDTDLAKAYDRLKKEYSK